MNETSTRSTKKERATMNKKVLTTLAAVLSLGAGAAVAAQATSGGGTTSVPPTEVVAPTILEDWCDLMALGFGSEPGSPTVSSAFDAALASGSVNPQVAYVALLEGVPAEVEGTYAVLRVAGARMIDGAPVADPEAVRSAAEALDGFIDASCTGA
jgi:hypothetical protein